MDHDDTKLNSQSLRDLKMMWPKYNISVTVKMHGLNSELVDLLWNTLPYRALQTHALVTGDHLYHLVPSEPLIVSFIIHFILPCQPRCNFPKTNFK